MMYLIAALAPWLLIAAAFAALAGWALAAERAAPAQASQRRERDKLVRDLARLAAGEATPQPSVASEADAARAAAAIRDGRIVELERALEHARSRAAELAGQLADHQRQADRNEADQEELARLRAKVAEHEARASETIDARVEPVALTAEAEPPEEETGALQSWRLRYFEQRVRFLEGRTGTGPAQGAAEAAQAALGWRLRDAEARAAFLEQQLRERERAQSTEASPFAANADVGTLQRWRMLYLERRAAHLQKAAQTSAPIEDVAREAASDPDRWRWRARYLESRVRHLEQRPPTPVAEPAAHVNGGKPEALPPPPLVPPGAEVRPPSLAAATAGAPDDFTLIDGVSPLQQSTLYSLGIYHFEQVAAWTPANVAWVDKYLRLRGRISEEEWVEQAAELAQFGVASARPHGEGARA